MHDIFLIKSIKNTTEQCSFGKQTIFCSCAKCPLTEVLALCRLCDNTALPSLFVLIAHRNAKSVPNELVPPYDIHQ